MTKGEGGLGRCSGFRPADSTSPPANSSGSIRHGRLLPRSLSAGWSAFKAAQKAAWTSLWLLSPTGAQLCAITTSPPGLAFTRFHSSLSRSQSTLLTQLRTGACDLGAYKAHFEPERLLCACGGEPETQEHFLLHCPLYAAPRAALLSSLRLKFLSLAYLLSDPRATRRLSGSSLTPAALTPLTPRPRRIRLAESPIHDPFLCTLFFSFFLSPSPIPLILSNLIFLAH